MALQFDALDGLYKEEGEYKKAYDENVITAQELSDAQARLKDEIRKELGLLPAE